MQTADLVNPPEELKRGTRLGNYELLLRIGRGGMATVWVARARGATRDQDRLVAVKAILSDLVGDQEFVRMFLDEGRIVQLIRHPNVVDVYEPGEHAGTMFLAMEWIEGESLHSIIAEAGKRRPIPPEMAVRIIADAAAGLHAAHELKDENGESMNVVHRDVSPHNILIKVDGAVKLVDFGVARAMGRLSEVTSAGQLKGKFGYMSPEQAMAKRVDRRADVFALGIVLFELTTGRRLFRGEHDAETLHLVVSGKIPVPSSIDPKYPKALEEIVMRALERDVAKRYQTAEELQHALEAYLKSERIVVPRAGIANLLKKVLGARIEQRRKAIRAALRAIDGEAPVGVNVPPSTELPGGDHITGVSSVTSSSGVSGVSDVMRPSSPSGLSGLSQPQPVSSSFSGPRPAGASDYGPAPSASQPSSVTGAFATSPYTHVGQPTVIVKRGGIGGYVIGVIGLALALGVALYFYFNPPQRKTTIVNVESTPQVDPAKPAAASPAPKPTSTDDPSVPTMDVESLGKNDPAKPPSRGGSPWKPPAPAATAKPSEKPTPPPATTAPPRQNPYE